MATTVDQKLLKATKFPPEFNQKVDMQKVNLEVMRKWIAGKISDILGSEDDVVIELCFNLIEGSRYPEIKKLQIQLTGFLEKDTPAFCKELWKLCLSAQNSPQGVPKELLEAKKLELIQEKVEAEKAAEEARRRREIDSQRERDMDSIRNRERDERGRGGYGMRNDNWRRGRGDRDFGRGGDNNRGGHRRSRSPGQWRAPPRDTDSYVPRGGGRRRDDNRRRSPSPALEKRPASASPSRSPPRRRRHSTSPSVSPPRRRNRSISRSPSPNRRGDSYRGRGGRGRRHSPDRRRRRSYSSSDSRSPSPAPRKRRRSPSLSKSRSPPPKSRRRRRDSSTSRSPSRSRNRSVSRSPIRGKSPMRRQASITPARDLIRPKPTSSRKGRDHDEHRLTRSHSRDERSLTPPRRQRQNTNRSRSRSISRSRSRARSPRRERKRRGSIERYAPRRHHTSSISPPNTKRIKRADIEEDERRRSPSPVESPRGRTRTRSISRPHSPANDDAEMTGTKDQEASADQPVPQEDPQKEASALREKLLREKIKKMRMLSISSNKAG
ncbi:hypothetical protein V500_00630 [Pseudogymnoascus sp. VKM F-4518 (FW-2643)]|nr:hypothetical protein V500_00630 [Pseudogymnoascus sp. VKM F-4518 (FW-2643)]